VALSPMFAMLVGYEVPDLLAARGPSGDRHRAVRLGRAALPRPARSASCAHDDPG
jgi:hypothetical protein